MDKKSTSDLVAAFLARGGVVSRVDPGERTMTERDMWLARRGEKTDNELIRERHVRGDVVYNGLGEIIGRL